jgi:hypothetical protein
MTTDPHNRPSALETNSGSAETTLRLIASLPAPEGFEDRIEAALRSAPRRGRLLPWPAYRQPSPPWFRVAAAATIAFVVVGGGWGVYSHVERQQAEKVILVPAPGPAGGGFSNAGAIRTPQTLIGPVVAPPAEASVNLQKPEKAQSTPKKKTARKKPRPAAPAKPDDATAAPHPAKD